MYSTCLHCTRDLGRNEMVETLPIGRRLAFDADKGRLWVVCASCGKWNLVPFDTRLESIDACERMFRDTRTRYSTDNIGMAKVGDGLTLVRVGRALRPEFASWRYGKQYARRRRIGLAVGALGGAAALGAAAGLSTFLGFGIAGAMYGAASVGFDAATGFRARLRTTNPESGTPITLSMANLKEAAIVWDEAQPMLRVRRKWWSNLPGYHKWSRDEMLSMGRRVVGGLNLTTGSRAHIAEAVDHLAWYNGDLSTWLRAEGEKNHGKYPDNYFPLAGASAADKARHSEDARRSRVRLADLPTEQRLAVEMWFSEDIERRWLEGELRLLEREWRDAEKLAKIADDLVLDEYP